MEFAAKETITPVISPTTAVAKGPASGLCLGCMNPKSGETVCPRCNWYDGMQADTGLYLRPGTVLKDQYIIGRMLGHGGFGITYIGWDTHLEIKLAIKEYLPTSL